MAVISRLDSILIATSGTTGLSSRSRQRLPQRQSQRRWHCWELDWQDCITVANERSNKQRLSTERSLAICQKEKAADHSAAFLVLRFSISLWERAGVRVYGRILG